MEITVSVVVPVYNAENHLEKCIDKILRQTFHNLRIILVNDGSTDGSGSICDAYAKKDERITVLHKENKGAGSARNTGLMAATGTFILFIDSDDYPETDMISHMVDSAIRYGSDMVVCGYYEVEGTVKNAVTIGDEDRSYDREKFYEFLLNAAQAPYFNPPWNKLYKTSIIRDNALLFDEYRTLGEDFVFNLDAIRCCRAFSTVSKPLYNYVSCNTESLTRKKRPDLWNETLYMYEKYKDFYIKSGLYEKYKPYVHAYLLTCIKIRLSNLFMWEKNRILRMDGIKQIVFSEDVTKDTLEIRAFDMLSKLTLFCIEKKAVFMLYILYGIKAYLYDRSGKAYYFLKSCMKSKQRGEGQ